MTTEEKHIFFNEKIYPYRGLISSVCRSFGKDEMSVEDLVQSIFLRIYNKVESVKNHTNLKLWVLVVSRNYCINQFRKESLRLNVQNGLEYYDKDMTYNLKDVLADRLQVFNKLKSNEKIALYMTSQGYKYIEVAKVLDIPEGTVGSLLFRAKEKIEKLK